MSSSRAVRMLLCAVVVLGAMSIGHTRAQAATASGAAVAGPGLRACLLSVSCATFQKTCSITAVNDIEMSIRRAAVGGMVGLFSWSATMTPVTERTLAVISFTAGCQPIDLPIGVSSGQTMRFPPGTVYFGVAPTAPFASLTWSMTLV